MTHPYSECSVGATGSCLKAAFTPWNAFDPKARELNTRLPPSQGLGMPDCPRGSCTSQVQVQGWAVGGERVQQPEDALGPTTFMHELRQTDALLEDTKKSRVFSKLTVSQGQPP